MGTQLGAISDFLCYTPGTSMELMPKVYYPKLLQLCPVYLTLEATLASLALSVLLTASIVLATTQLSTVCHFDQANVV